MPFRDLYRFLDKRLTTAELQVLCEMSGADWDNLQGDIRIMKAMHLQEHHSNRGQEAQLLATVAELRPDLDLRPFGGPGPQGAQPAAPSTTPQMHYESLDVEVRPGLSAGEYVVRVSASPTGESEDVTQRLDLTDATLQARMSALRHGTLREDEARALGQQLRDFLLPPPLWGRLDSSLHSLAVGQGLRLRLRVEPPALSRLPWELLYDPTYDFLAQNPRTPLVRYIAEPFAAPNIAVPTPLRVLLAVASPDDLEQLDVDAEIQQLRSALEPLGALVNLRVVPHTTWQALLDGFIAHEPHIFHFVGHGLSSPTGEGALALENEHKLTHSINASMLRTLLRGRNVSVALLNCCHSATAPSGDAILALAPSLVRAQVPAVIAMQGLIQDDTARFFARTLYPYLVQGLPLDRAVAELRVAALALPNPLEWALPTLFMRAPNGLLWGARSAGSQ